MEPLDQNEDRKSHIAPLRTFSSDLADAVREKGGSVVRIAIEEDERHRQEIQEGSIRSKKNLAFTIAGCICILGALAFAYFSYQQKRSAQVLVVPVVVQPSSLIASETSQTIDATGMQVADLLSAVHAIVTDPGTEKGTVKNIVISQKSPAGTVVRVPASQFIGTLGTHAPDGLVRSLSPEYMLGTYLYDQNNLFLILHGTAHDFLLAGMLQWEPYLFADMVPLFNIDTSGFTKAELQSVTFADTVIQNRDARAVLDANKVPLLFYSFLDQNTIVIAQDPKTLTEVIRRY